ncbi:hypothetical protein GCM10019059_23670 [Camelimonas fluminis]|uniref:Histidine kinase n=1 Tax=Camelimonas fluminis TaxID=1576911 RepID=A0ABV7UHS7_9HYPH|nr:histidine kinase [Camelimonas fluminis]GHE63317.1 hypothetical protein GCM10019059_23670 [Camelimonas fluminis]
MPTLFRLLAILAVAGAVAAAAMTALATLVTPTPREITTTIRLPPDSKAPTGAGHAR